MSMKIKRHKKQLYYLLASLISLPAMAQASDTSAAGKGHAQVEAGNKRKRGAQGGAELLDSRENL